MLTNDANGSAIADAVMITPVDSLNRAVWTPTLPAAKQYNVYAWWPASSSYNSVSTFRVHHDGGASDVIKNQETAGGQWNLLKGTIGVVVDLVDNGDAICCRDDTP